LSLLKSVLLSLLIYMLFEKPGIDARVIFKNKLQLKQELQELEDQEGLDPLIS